MTENSAEKMWYDFQSIEQKWLSTDPFVTENTDAGNDFSVAVPTLATGYDLTLSQVRGLVIADVLARYKRMIGYNVHFPLGWNCFTKDANKKTEKSSYRPAKINQKELTSQAEIIQQLGISNKSTQKFSTTDPDFVRWLHGFFIKMYRAEHVYYKKKTVPWCPRCKTFVPGAPDTDKLCWRCGDEIGRKAVSGWYLNIGKFKKELRQNLHNIDQWPSMVRTNLQNLLVRNIALESWDCCLTRNTPNGVPIPHSVCTKSEHNSTTFNECLR